MTLAKIKAVVVAEQARGQRIGPSLLKRCRQIYFQTGYQLIYGQVHTRWKLEPFYTRLGFTVLDEGVRFPGGRSRTPQPRLLAPTQQRRTAKVPSWIDAGNDHTSCRLPSNPGRGAWAVPRSLE